MGELHLNKTDNNLSQDNKVATGRRNRLPMAGVILLGIVVIATASVFLLSRLNSRAEGPTFTDSKATLGMPIAIDGVKEGLALPEKDRKFLWDVEHLGTVLRKDGFKPLANAIKKSNRELLLSLLSPDFLGLIPGYADTIQVNLDFASASRLETDGFPHKSINRQQFVNWLIGYRSMFYKDPAVSISLMTLSPVNRENIDGPWEGGCRLRIWGETSPDSPAEVVFYLHLDMNKPTEELLNRGNWLHSCTIKKVKMGQSDHYLMQDVTAQWGLDTKWLHDNWNHGPARTQTNPGGVYLCDFNHDGFVDMLVNDVALLRGYTLYQGLPEGKLRDVTLDVGLPPMNLASIVAFVDLDGDSWEDLILGPGLIFRNNEGNWFENVTSRSNLTELTDLRKTQGYSGIAISDYDRDSRMDLYVFRSSSRPRQGSWVAGKMGEDYENHLLRNVGDWKFEDVTKRSKTDGGKRSTFSAVWFDANNDNWPDLYVIHEFGNGLLLINKGNGVFKEQNIVDSPADFGSMGITCGDIDNDGLIDLYVASMYSKSGNRVMSNLRPDAYPELLMQELRRMVAGNQLYRNMGNGQFEPLGSRYEVRGVGWAYGPAMVDLDNDGWLDMYATAGFVSRDRSKPDG